MPKSQEELNALKALEAVNTEPSNAEVDKLVKTFATAVIQDTPDLEFTTKTITEWAQAFCELESVELPAAFKSVYAFGKYVKKHPTLMSDAGIREIGTYGNRDVYAVQDNPEGDFR